jgi:UDP-3-O-[3-hydroxymyristoyl] glucosamine N-acyltransferase
MAEFTIEELSKQLKAVLVGDKSIKIYGVAPIEKAISGQITFIANPKYKSYLSSTKASAIIIDHKLDVEPSLPYLKVADAYYGFLQIFLMFNPKKNLLKTGIHPSAQVVSSSKIEKNVSVGANVYIGENVRIGKRTQVFPNCVILDDTDIGEDCTLYPSVTIRENCKIGDRVILQSGVVIGSDGFGFAPHEGRYHKIPQLGTVIIEDDVEVGANTVIDRATMGETIIKAGVKLDNLIQIAHNVLINENTVIAAQTGISGSTTIGKNTIIGGQVGTVGHISIGDRVQIGAQSGVSKNIPSGQVYFGYPARPIMKTKRIEAILNNLPELIRKIKTLENKIANLERKATGD